MVQGIVGRREIEQGILWLDEMGKKDSCKPRIASFISCQRLILSNTEFRVYLM